MKAFLKSLKLFEKDLLKAWSKTHYDFAAFPDLADVYLKKHQLHTKFPGREKWLNYIVDSAKHPDIHHYDLNSTENVHFTLLRNPHFFIDLYSWIDHTEIHAHNFIGAFQVFSGTFSQFSFNYQEKKKIDKQISTGELKIVSRKNLKIGSVESIHEKDRFIHQVLHFNVPAISLCIRIPDTKDDYCSYFYPGLCLGEMLFTRPEYLRIKAFSQTCKLTKKFSSELAIKLIDGLNQSSLLYDYMNDLRSFKLSEAHKKKLGNLIDKRYKNKKLDLSKIKKQHNNFLSKLELGF